MGFRLTVNPPMEMWQSFVTYLEIAWEREITLLSVPVFTDQPFNLYVLYIKTPFHIMGLNKLKNLSMSSKKSDQKYD